MRIFAQDAALYRKCQVDGTDDPEALPAAEGAGGH